MATVTDAQIEAARLDANGLTADGAITNRGRWVLRVCADRYLDATFELDSPREDGGIDRSRVTRLAFVEITDTHK